MQDFTFNFSEKERKFIDNTNGKINNHRFYLLRQDAELYQTSAQWQSLSGIDDLTKEEFDAIFCFTHLTK
jgi:hypothetical protein